MQKEGRSVDQGRGIDGLKIGIGLVVAGGMIGAAGGVVTESTGLLLVGGAILLIGIIAGATFGGSAGDSGGDVGAGSGGEGGGGEGSAGGVGCFTAGTLVLLAGGEMKPIETVKVGEYVISRDENTGGTTPQRVKQMWTHNVPATLLLHLASGEILETTKEHRFFVADRGFVGAGHLASGSALEKHSGENARVTELEPLQQHAKVYNLEIENFHTYFVGRGGLWVHNRKESDPFDPVLED